MPKWKEGERAKIVTRPVTEEDRKKNAYYDHMAGLTGVIQNAYADNTYALMVDSQALTGINKQIHKDATTHLRKRFDPTEAQRKLLSSEELDFDIHFMLLVQEADLEKA